ncbi:Pentatricopeptide repeat-containing protein [Nymphaea thermarum]|nr:Pentatricopeptide repeat-containing protein [Nymphaea thermarum]
MAIPACARLARLLQMMWQGISPDEVSFACALRMLANSDALEAGKQIHASAIKSGSELNLYVGSALVDMYAKCASVEEAHNILAQMPGFEYDQVRYAPTSKI